MFESSLPGSVGDYSASLGALAIDTPMDTSNGDSIQPDGPFQAIMGVRFAQITDGLSNTLLVGEKHVPPGSLYTYPYDCGIFDGHNSVCHTRAAGPNYPLAVTANDPGWKFGSVHAGIVQFVFCDGSVHSLEKSINPVTLGLLAQRDDGQPVPEY